MKAKTVYYPQGRGHLGPEELADVFAQIGRNDPLWQALMQLLQQRLANATVAAVAREENAPGRLEELLDFQRELEGFRGLATLTEEKLTAKAARNGPKRHRRAAGY
jgi:hypothetical protein